MALMWITVGASQIRISKDGSINNDSLCSDGASPMVRLASTLCPPPPSTSCNKDRNGQMRCTRWEINFHSFVDKVLYASCQCRGWFYSIQLRDITSEEWTVVKVSLSKPEIDINELELSSWCFLYWSLNWTILYLRFPGPSILAKYSSCSLFSKLCVLPGFGNHVKCS